MKLLKKAMIGYVNPHIVVMDRCSSYLVAMKAIGNVSREEHGRHLRNRTESSHLPFRRRERAMSRSPGNAKSSGIRFNPFVCVQSLQSSKQYRQQGQVQIAT
nr:DDE-type integrase/transposase/recombinase [uncultured Hyphomonas sp.]